MDATLEMPRLAILLKHFAQLADYVLAVKDNQPSLKAEIAGFFEVTPAAALDTAIDIDKHHGRIEIRTVSVTHQVDWMASNRRHPGEWRFVGLAAIVGVEAIIEKAGKITDERRFYIASATLSAAPAAQLIRGHWRIENSLHWVLDVQFSEDLSRLRRGHGAANMAVARPFALNIVRSANDKRSQTAPKNPPASTPKTAEFRQSRKIGA